MTLKRMDQYLVAFSFAFWIGAFLMGTLAIKFLTMCLGESLSIRVPVLLPRVILEFQDGAD